MTRNLKIIIAAIVIVIALVAWKIIGGSSSGDPRRINTPLVKIELPKRQTMNYTLKFTGDVLPIQAASIFSKVNGNLDRVYVDIGAQVKENQLLALIDTTELAQQFRLASATYQNARLTYERTKVLEERNLIAKQDLDNSEAAMKVAKANFDAAMTRLSYARITAPFSGYVTKRFLDAGANVTSNNATLFTLMDLDAMKIIINVLEKDIPIVTIGKNAVIHVDAFPDKEFVGAITRLSEAVDLSTRTMAVQIDIPNKDHLLKPGMFASVTLIVDEHRNAVTVPTQALLKDDKGYFVYSVTQGSAHRKNIKSGLEENGRIEILSGVSSDDSIISTGQQFAKDGGPVLVQQ